ncbi:nitroreductase [Candidatus Sororendozoicomonas aggregata]|uniref:nitroreductase n=1 Tax=Candidatus Sororendozoicomonas aggregata TaxID=3073239 RepID=UPI002ED33136
MTTISHVIRQRKSTRAFLNKPVSTGTITQILDTARFAPSGTNTQPWQVAVVSGQKKQSLDQQMFDAFNQGVKGEMEYQYYPEDMGEPYLSRRRTCGKLLYEILGITRKDVVQRRIQWGKNYKAFDAPVALYFFLDKKLKKGSWLDCGMFLQNIMLAAHDHGLATCAQGALGQYPAIVKKSLGYSDDKILVCGMAIGYEDKAAIINTYRTPRETVENFTTFFQ